MTARYRSKAGRISWPMTSSSWSRISGASSRRLGQRPLGIRLVQELVELLDDLRAQHRDCRASLGRAASKVGDGLVEIGGHGAPALEEGIGLGGRADRLVGGDVQQLDLRPVHRVDVEGGDVGVEDGAVDPQRVGEGGASGRVPLVANVGQLELEPVEERAPRLVRLARVVLEPVVEASVAERRGEGRVATKGRLPVRVGEAVEGGRCGCGGHAVMLATARGHWMTPMNSIVAIIRSRTARLRS